MTRQGYTEVSSDSRATASKNLAGLMGAVALSIQGKGDIMAAFFYFFGIFGVALGLTLIPMLGVPGIMLAVSGLLSLNAADISIR